MTNDFKIPSPDDHHETLVSKTQLKNEAKELIDFGKLLVGLTPAKLKLLPLSEKTMIAIHDYHKQRGNIARKRHLGFIGKCLRTDDDVQSAKLILEQDNFNPRHQSVQKRTQKEPFDLIAKLIDGDNEEIEQLLTQHTALDRQTLRQLVRNAKNSKTEQKKLTTSAKLKTFLQNNQII